MKCPHCKTEAVIKNVETVATGKILHFMCRNKKCQAFFNKIGEEKLEDKANKA